jgi:hypothetical protein
VINKNFRDNWLKILDFNKNRNILQDPEKSDDIVRVPLTPIIVNANILHYLFDVLYPRFINDQNNILDIIIQEIDKKNKIIKSFLYETNKPGIHETVELIPEKFLKIKNIEFEKIDDIFDKAQKALLKEKHIQISSIRIFRKEAITLINEHCKNIEDLSINEFFHQSLDLLQNIFEKDLIFIYPEPIVINFIRNFLSLLNQVRFNSIFEFIEEGVPEFNISIIIEGKTTKIIALVQNTIQKNKRSNLKLNFFTPTELGINAGDSDIKSILNLIQDKIHSEKVYFFKENDILTYISDIFELLFPLKKDNLSFLFQKALFGYRSFETHWDMVPKPKIYKILIRFLIRLLGFNLNLKKISHWAIPEAISTNIDFFFGLNSKILIFITDLDRTKKVKTQDIKNTCLYSFFLEFEDSTLKRIRKIETDKLFQKINSDSLKSISDASIEMLGRPSTIIILDKKLLQEIIKNLIFEHSKFSFIPKFKTLKLLKNEKYFTMYPEFPFFRLIKKKSSLSLFKLVLPIVIDKFEF